MNLAVNSRPAAASRINPFRSSRFLVFIAVSVWLAHDFMSGAACFTVVRYRRANGPKRRSLSRVFLQHCCSMA
jgi:hypothetical protein